MNITSTARASDQPLIALVMQGRTGSAGAALRPAEHDWHLVFVRREGQRRALLVGPKSRAGVASWGADADLLWIRFRPGTFMPQHPLRTLVDQEVPLPAAPGGRFWLHGAAWDAPDFDHAEVFVERLARQGLLRRDPLVHAALTGGPIQVPDRTLRDHFARTAGLTLTQIRQVARAQEAAELLRRGVAIADVVFLAGYADQPHLTRAVRRWIGRTPAQLRPSP